MTAEPTSNFFQAPDGRRLHVREYGAPRDAEVPVICLPGLTRTVADFEMLAGALAAEGHHVLALDSRGRGLSDYDPNPAMYSLLVELSDLTALLTVRDIKSAVFIGSSRGGLLIMLLAGVQPACIAGAILNDIGPVIEPQGLMRIKGYVGKFPQPQSFEEGGDILRSMFSNQFPTLARADWIAWAKRSWRHKDGRFSPTYDPLIAKGLESFDPAVPIPQLWPQFDALANVPVMVIRGENSDLLSPETIAAMKARRPNLFTLEIPDQGHTPLLEDQPTIQKIAAFVYTCGARR